MHLGRRRQTTNCAGNYVCVIFDAKRHIAQIPALERANVTGQFNATKVLI